MDLPPPSVPESRLTGWRQTESRVESPFSTPIVSAHTHTLVYEETAQREAICEATGVDQPWRFFFGSRIRLTPSQPPSPLLTGLIRRNVTAAFVDRLADRGFEQIREVESQSIRVAGITGRRYRYRALLRLDVAGDDAESDDENDAVLDLPVEGFVTIWADGDYQVAGGAHPFGPPGDGPAELTAALRETIDSTAAREELLALIDSCLG